MTYELVCGDSIDALQNYRGRPIDLTVTSPPYDLNIKYTDWDDDRAYPEYLIWAQAWLAGLLQATSPGGRLCLNVPLDTNKGGERPVYADLLTTARQAGWRYKGTIVWNEGNISKRTAWGSWRSATAPTLICPVETILVLYKPGPYPANPWKRPLPAGVNRHHVDRDLFMEATLALWSFPGEKKKRFNHPAPFPEELPRRCIDLFSFPGDLVCDPFLGSGTTGAVCTDRDFLGIDISPEYVEIARDRIQAAHPEAVVQTRRD